MITASAPDGRPAMLSPQESYRLVAAIEVRLHAMAGGVSPPSNVEDLRKAYESDSEIGHHLIAAFSVGEPFPVSKVYVLEKKGDRTVAVWVDNQGGWPLGVPFTDSLIEAVRLAFGEALPDYDVAVEESMGLDLR